MRDNKQHKCPICESDDLGHVKGKIVGANLIECEGCGKRFYVPSGVVRMKSSDYLLRIDELVEHDAHEIARLVRNGDRIITELFKCGCPKCQRAIEILNEIEAANGGA